MRKERRRLTRLMLRLCVGFIVITWLPILILRWADPPLTAFMLLHNEATLEATRYTWRDRSELGDAFALAVMAAEDQNFPHHHGLDVHAMAKALEDREHSGRLRGASGISQQLVKNIFLWPGRNLVRKALEAYLAVVMEILLPKARILELYLNVVELGPGLYGLPAAATSVFAAEPSELSIEQAALLAAVLPNPRRLKAAAPSDYVRERQAWIAAQAARLEREGWLTQIEW